MPNQPQKILLVNYSGLVLVLCTSIPVLVLVSRYYLISWTGQQSSKFILPRTNIA